MGHNTATWKLLEEMLIELKKKGVNVPSDIMEDLRAAKSMIKLSCMQGGGDAIQKAEEYTANVEAYLINEAQKIFGSETADQWLRRLEEANVEICDETKAEATLSLAFLETKNGFELNQSRLCRLRGFCKSPKNKT